MDSIVTAIRSINRSENVDAKPFDKSTSVPLFNKKARIASPDFAGVMARANPAMKTLKLKK
jgi:hypothetical protein